MKPSAGFANPNIVLIGAMFVIGEALARTGVDRRIGDWLATRGGNRPWRQLGILMLAVGLLGSVMSSTGVVAMFVPVVMRIAARTGIAPSQLLMPMAYAALISGMMTLVATSPNLVINYELVRHGADGFNFFSFTPFGAPILLASILYMNFARRWLRADQCRRWPDAGPAETQKMGQALSTRRSRISSSRAAGVTLAEAPIGKLNVTERLGVRIILIERGSGRNRQVLARSPHSRIQENDVLLIDFDSPPDDVSALSEEFKVDPLPAVGQLFRRPLAGCRHGRSHSSGKFTLRTQDGRRGRKP